MDEIDKYLNDVWAGIILDAGIIIILLKLALTIKPGSFLDILIYVLLVALLVALIFRCVQIYKQSAKERINTHDAKQQYKKQDVEKILDDNAGDKSLMNYVDKLSSLLFVLAVVLLFVKPDVPDFVFFIIAGVILLLAIVKILRLSVKR